MATISNTPRPGYAWDATDNVWYPIGTGPHTHADYITSSSAINPSIVDAKGDIIAATAADTVARLAVGANDTVLTADSTAATGLKWATPASGGMTLLSTTTLTGASVTLSSIPQTYNNLQLVIQNFKPAGDNEFFAVRFNGDTTANRHRTTSSDEVNSGQSAQVFNNTLSTTSASDNSVAQGLISINFYNYTNTTTWKFAHSVGITNNSTTTTSVNVHNKMLVYNQIDAITSLTLLAESGNFTSGTALLYGVK